MVVRMLRRRSVKVRRCRMRRRQVVIMPMDVNRAAAVPMGVLIRVSTATPPRMGA